MRRLICFFAFICVSIMPVWANNVTLVNPSFEVPILPCSPATSCAADGASGWAATGTTLTWKAPIIYFPTIPDGTNVLQLGSRFNGPPATAAQALSTTLQHNTTYTLAFSVGNAIGTTFAGYKVELIAGSTTLASASTPLPDAGSFLASRLVFRSQNADPSLIGQPLTIRLTGGGVAGQFTFFDKISLDASPTIFHGVISQFATGGGWATTLNLLNLASAPNAVHIAFFDENGKEVVAPLAAAPQVTVSPAGGIDATIAPWASLLLQSDGTTSNSNSQVAWVQVNSSEPTSGYAIFRYRSADGSISEGTNPIDASETSTLVLPFDNTGGYRTAVALANTAGTPVVINAKIMDESGNPIGLQALTLQPMGHTSLFSDQFAVAGGRRGIIQFQNTAGTPIGAIGLRFNSSGTFTSIPIVPQ